MAVDPDDLRYVLAVARAGSLIAAARALGVDKATVIRRLDALEESLGTELVERSPRRWSLTRAGGVVAEAAVQIEGLIRCLETDVRGGAVTGVVRITAPAFFARQFLIPEMGVFQAAHPGVELRLITTNAMLDLARREADVAVRNVRPDRGHFVSRRLGVLTHAVYASRDYLARRGTPTRREDLRSHHLIGYEGRLVYQAELAWLLAMEMPVALRVSDTLTLVDGTKAGLGIAALPLAVGEPEPDLVRLDLCGRGRDEIWCVYPEELREARPIRAAVEWLADVWARHGDALEGSAADTPR